MTDFQTRVEEILEFEEEQRGLFICLTPCYIYSNAGNDDGTPQKDSDIIYDAVRDEIIQVNIEARIGKYLKCLLPEPGWVYCPNADKMYDNAYQDLESEYEQQRERDGVKPKLLVSRYKAKEDGQTHLVSSDDDDMNNNEVRAPKPMMNDIDGDHKYEDIDGDMDLRRDYEGQKMQLCTKLNAPDFEIDEEDQKCFYKNQYIRGLLFFFRRNPFVPGLIILGIQGIIEIFIFIDFVSDLLVALQLGAGLRVGTIKTPFIFATAMAFISSPYLIAWTVLSQYSSRQLTQARKAFCLKKWIKVLFILIFDIAPIGILIIIAHDVYHLIECVLIKPLYYLVTLGKDFRMISYEELGYYKLRRVAEIFSEALPQAVLQGFLVVVLRGEKLCNKCSTSSVVVAFISSLLVFVLWSTIIKIEGGVNGMGFVEYVTVIFQGSFKFVPFLPAIERGTEKGVRVNWTHYKFSIDSIGTVGAGLNSPQCILERIKISDYTLKALHRYGCRYFGQSLKNRRITEELPDPIEIIQSRMADEIEALFNQFDKDQSKSFDYEEFLQVCLILKAQQKEPCLRYDVDNIYLDLADGYIREIWFLDLLLKIKGSTDIVPLLDITNPLQNAFNKKNLKMISLLVGADYTERDEQNFKEWELASANAVVRAVNKDDAIKEENAKCALALCEHRGVPIVVQLIKGDNLLPMDDDGKSDPYVRITVEGVQKASIVRNETLNPVWNENSLFIIDFERAEYLLGLTEEMTSKSQINLEQNPDDGVNIAELVYSKQLPAYAIDQITKSHPDLVQKVESEYNFGGHSIYDMSGAINDEKKDDGNAFGGQISQQNTLLGSQANFSRRGTRIGKTGNQLTILFRVFDKDVDSEDDFMGSYRMKISLKDMENPIENFHEKIHTVKLQYKDPQTKKTKYAGTISFKIFLNIAYLYQQHGIHYIDYGTDAKAGEIQNFSDDVWEDQDLLAETQRPVGNRISFR